jgi:hypothetical protein
MSSQDNSDDKRRTFFRALLDEAPGIVFWFGLMALFYFFPDNHVVFWVVLGLGTMAVILDR